MKSLQPGKRKLTVEVFLISEFRNQNYLLLHSIFGQTDRLPGFHFEKSVMSDN